MFFGLGIATEIDNGNTMIVYAWFGVIFLIFFKVLSELIKDITGKLHKSEYERKAINQQLADMKDSIQQAEATQQVNAKLFFSSCLLILDFQSSTAFHL